VQGLGKAIFFGALTTAVGFLALMLAGSRGFTQLGVLIALGIALAGIFMLTVFFLFLPRKTPAPGHDWMFTLVKRYVRWPCCTRANALDFGAAPFIAERRRAPCKAAVDLRCQHSFDGTEAQRRRLCAQDDHGKNAGALGNRSSAW